MRIETCIDSLVSYAMNTGLCEPVDHQVATNRLLDLLHIPDYAPSQELLSEDLEEILAGILDYACEKGLCEDNITARDIFDTRIMGALTPMPREVIRTFRKKYARSPREATDWYYHFSCDTDYIRRYRIARDLRWKYRSDYGELDITINLSKPWCQFILNIISYTTSILPGFNRKSNNRQHGHTTNQRSWFSLNPIRQF